MSGIDWQQELRDWCERQFKMTFQEVLDWHPHEGDHSGRFTPEQAQAICDGLSDLSFLLLHDSDHRKSEDTYMVFSDGILPPAPDMPHLKLVQGEGRIGQNVRMDGIVEGIRARTQWSPFVECHGPPKPSNNVFRNHLNLLALLGWSNA